MSIVRFVIDEAASLGPLDQISDMIAIGRGYGIRLLLCYQALGQLKKCFPQGQDETVLSATAQIFIGINDNATADYASAHIGDSTVVVDSGGSSSGDSRQSTQGIHPSTSRSYSYNSSSNWQQQSRRLVKPEELMAQHPRTMITFVAGMPPIRTTSVRYYEKNFVAHFGWMKRAKSACLTLLASAAFAAATAIGAVVATDELDKSQQHFVAPMVVPANFRMNGASSRMFNQGHTENRHVQSGKATF
jgi:type IV secretion system protein VirD4